MTDRSEHPLHRAAGELAAWAWTDSRVELNEATLRRLLADDSESSGYLPTDMQCMEFICGDDTGEPPAKLVKDFPRTHAYVGEFWS
jgi:hypothetical protein